MPDIPSWLAVTLLVVWAFFLGRWSANRGRDGQGARTLTGDSQLSGGYQGGAGVDASGGGAQVLSLAGEAAVRQMIRQGHKIEAIKRVRAELGIGLKEAKDFVEAMER